MSVQQLGFRLYLVTDRHQTGGRPLTDVIEECLGAGVRVVQLREKDLTAADLLALAQPLRGLTRRAGAGLFINDRVDVALAVEADGVQRGHTSLPIRLVRAVAGARLLIGASVHGLEEARGAESEGADFLVFGPVYDTPSKRPYGPPQGVEALGRVVEAVRAPVFAIGGLTPERVGEVRAAGAHGVAVISAILAADRPGAASKAFLDALGSA
ncbi:MAG: thiamine phosphate synthase [Candidatus Rokubacteria bacterium]|nr:thiamine phosphate synthase [Candidatus Rokubacteria bacterium]